MSKKASPATIGGFVIVAILLIVVATIIFGGSNFFEPQQRLVAYFPESVKGLRNGANVLFRGVRIGYVEAIQLQGDADTGETLVQVTMLINPDRYKLTRDGELLDGRSIEEIEPVDLTGIGLRAQLGVESFVTGQLVIEYEFFPDSEPVFRGVNPPYEEIPTVANNIQQLVERVQRFVADITENLDLKQIGEDVQAAAQGVRELATSQELRSSISGLDKLVNSEDTQQLTTRLGATLDDARAALGSAKALLADAESDLGPVIDDVRKVLGRLDSTLAAAQSTLNSADEQLRGDTQLSYQLIDTLEEVESASRSLRVFMDYLERNPEALLRGKRAP